MPGYTPNIFNIYRYVAVFSEKYHITVFERKTKVSCYKQTKALSYDCKEKAKYHIWYLNELPEVRWAK